MLKVLSEDKMEIVYALEPVKDIQSEPGYPVFLVGPTPRSRVVKSWRPEALKIMKDSYFNGSIYIPEDRSGKYSHDYNHQVEWEHEALEHCRKHGAIMAWVPRNLQNMPAFTTNVEFGMYVKEENFFYGRPNNSEKNRYLDWAYEKFRKENPSDTLEALIEEVSLYFDT
jgi:hypothetical protein